MLYNDTHYNSPIDIRSESLTRSYHEKSLYFNVDDAKQSFVNAYKDSGGDPFGSFVDPLVVGFKIFWHFDAKSGLLADEMYQNSAIAYLKRIGQHKRADLLKRFINVLSKVSTYSPWMFQSIDGVADLYNTEFSSYYNKHTITINCLETIDWRISSLASMYRQIVFDYERMVEVLPVNLRRFSMSIYVYDFRMFSDMQTNNIELLQTIQNQDVRQLNHNMFDLGYCQFDISSGSNMFDNVSNINHEPVSNNLVITTEKYAYSSLFRSITGDSSINHKSVEIAETALTGTTKGFLPSRLPVLDNVAERLDNFLDVDNWKRQLGNVVQQADLRISNLVNAELTNVFLGNVHNFGISDVFNIGGSDNFTETFTRTRQAVQGSPSLQNDKPSTNLGNINRR